MAYIVQNVDVLDLKPSTGVGIRSNTSTFCTI